MKRAFLALALASPCAAQADETGYDPLVFETCLVARQGDDLRACVGLAAARCMLGAGLGSTRTAVACFEAEAEAWSDLQGRASEQLHGEVLSNEHGMGTNKEELLDHLDGERIAWMTWRDMACGFEKAAAPVLQVQDVDLAACLMRKSAERFFDLRARLKAPFELP